ncbi:Signal transduction histidine kinase [Selenomonas ruminantium]|uniref:histidine kinase n=1 Tax=Selenomonas ruminantium TaxID=971 RepID=A0A1M6TMX8_SELRU|nr:ATP-binding protein [Selenomonas ruminantium]SHK58239.1 Signal transduction histidine kinase [Selenomonas ruminantium]
MIQYNYTLNWSAGDQGFWDKLEKVLQTLSMRPASKQANAIFMQLSFHKMPLEEAMKVREKIRVFLPRAVVVGMTETLFFGNAGGYMRINCSFFQNAKIRLAEIAGVPEDYGRTGLELGQKMAAMQDVRAALVLGTMDADFGRFLEAFVCGNENVVVFGNMTGSVGHVGEEVSITSSDILSDHRQKYFLLGSEVMEQGIVVVMFCGKNLSVRADYVLSWKPIGKEMVITETMGPNVISRLDNMPAVDIYRHYLKVKPDENFVYNIAEFPLTINRNDCLIARVPPGFDEEGRIFFNGDVKVGERVRLTYAVREDFLHETELASEKMSQFAPEGMYISACGTRSLFLQMQESEEIRYYQRIANQLFCSSGTGEIYCYQGHGGLLNCALVAVGFREGGNKSALNIFDEPEEEQENTKMLLSTRMAAFLDAITRELAESNQELHDLARKNEENSIAKYKFLAGVGRDIAQPLKTVIELERKIRRESTEAKIKEYAKDCYIAGEKVYNIIQRIFDYLQMEAGEFAINEGEYKIIDLVRNLKSEIGEEAEAKGLDFVVEMPADMPSVLYGDELRLRQILLNILSNSVKFTVAGTIQLQFRVEKTGPADIRIYVTVKDTGIGITAENMAAMQEMLSLNEDKTLNMLNETGLGLNVTQRLLHLFGSELQMESEAGKGTECSFAINQRVLNWVPVKSEKNMPLIEKEEKLPITDEELLETIEALREIAEARDGDSLEYMLETLEGYILPEQPARMLLELQTAAKEGDWEQIQKLVE